jgi:hypothetical protein
MRGALRIHGELLKLGFEVAESTVSKYDRASQADPTCWVAYCEALRPSKQEMPHSKSGVF